MSCAWMLRLAGVSVFWVLLLGGCQRSAQFRRDQSYYQPETPSYYRRGQTEEPEGDGTKAPTATQKLEALGQPKKRVVVLDFWNNSLFVSEKLGAFAADELRRGLYASQKVILPTDLRLERRTEDFVQGDQVKVAQLIREGRQLGVAVVVIGRISKVVFRERGDEIGLFRQKQSMAAVDVEVKVFDVVHGREVWAGGKSGESSSHAFIAVEGQNVESKEYRLELTQLALRHALSQLVPEVIQAVQKMTWEGHIAKIIGKKIYINAGKNSGLVAGDILKVMTPGEEIYDTKTGAYLGRAPGQLKGTVEIVEFIGPDGAVAEVHTGGHFQEGDPVQLY